MDDGESWKKGYAILKHNEIERWLSPETLRLFPDFAFYMKNSDYSGWVTRLFNWAWDRLTHFVRNITFFGTIQFFMNF